MTTKKIIQETNFLVPELHEEQMLVLIKGTSPLIFHKWSEKAKKQIRDKQFKKASAGRETRDPEQEIKDSFYYTEMGEIAFPALCLKNSIINAGRFMGKAFPMTFIRGALFVVGDKDGMLKVDYKEKGSREDMVRVNMGGADLRYRGELKEWGIKMLVSFNAAIISKEQVLTLIKVAGYSVGLGEWRPEKSGDFGRFKIAISKEEYNL